MSKDYETKTKLVYARAITTAKNDVFLGYNLKNVIYGEGEIDFLGCPN